MYLKEKKIEQWGAEGKGGGKDGSRCVITMLIAQGNNKINARLI